MGSVVSALRKLFGKEPQCPVALPQAVVEVKKMSREEIITEARESMGINADGEYNIGIVGTSGVGKSTLVNALRGTQGDDRAAVGIVECTQQITRYDVPGMPFLKLWDLPGGGTARHPAETYFMDKRIYAFDVVCILYDDRLDEVALKVAKGCLDYGTPFVFMRTKCGDMVRAHRRNEGIQDLKRAIEDARRVVLENLYMQLRQIRPSFHHVRHFFVDAYDIEDGVPLRFDEKEWLEWIGVQCESRRQNGQTRSRHGDQVTRKIANYPEWDEREGTSAGCRLRAGEVVAHTERSN